MEKEKGVAKRKIKKASFLLSALKTVMIVKRENNKKGK